MAKRIYDEAQIRVNFFMPQFLMDAVRERAKASGVPMSQVVRDALIKHLEVSHGPVHHEENGA